MKRALTESEAASAALAATAKPAEAPAERACRSDARPAGAAPRQRDGRGRLLPATAGHPAQRALNAYEDLTDLHSDLQKMGIPREVWPADLRSCRGKWSYTITGPKGGVVEVLVRSRSFRMKRAAGGAVLGANVQPGCAWGSSPQQAWREVAKTLGW